MPEVTFEPNARPGEVVDSFVQGVDKGQSWMAQMQQRRMRDQQIQQNDAQLALEALQRPLKEAETQANIARAKTAYDGALQTQALRTQAYQLKAQADSDFDHLNLITDDKARAVASREWLSRYAQLANIAELKDEFAVKNHLATSNVVDSMKLNMLTGADFRSFQALTKDLSPEDQEKAREIKLGLTGRASSAGKKSQTVKLPDGSEAEMVFDPNSGQYTIPSINAAKPAPAPGSMATNPFVSQSSEEKARATETGKASAENTARLTKEKPKRQMALRQAEVLTDRMEKDLDELIGKVSAQTAGPGGVLLEKFPGTAARDFASALDTIKANIGFQTLQAMREASPTGGALGQVSDVENKLLQSTLGSLQIGQSPTQLVENLRKVKQRLVQNFGITRAAFDNEFGTTSGGSDVHPPGWDGEKQKRLEELRSKLGK